MFAQRVAGVAPSWKHVEDDFVLGACSRRIIGFAARGDDGRWTAFDHESEPIGDFAHAADAKHAVHAGHVEMHETDCASPVNRVWATLAERRRAARV